MLKVNRFYHKYSFWAKYILALVIIILTLLGIYDEKLFYIRTRFLVSSMFILLLLFGSGSMLKRMRIGFGLDFIPKRNLEDNLMYLARRMGSNLTTYTPVINYDSAFVSGKRLVIGETVRTRLSSEEIESVLAHELSHIIRKNYCLRVRFIQIVISIFPPLFFIFVLRFPVTNVQSFFICTVFPMFYCSAPISWYIELDSDTTAVAYTDKMNLITALSTLYEGQLDAFSLEHPSVNYRIKNLRKETSQY